MAVYAGVNGKARKHKALYGGVNGIARKIAKGYVGVSGVARPFMTGSSGGSVTYFGIETDDDLYNFYNGASTSVGNYIVIGGGRWNGNTSKVIAYNSDTMLKTTLSNLSVARYFLSAASIAGYAIFAGGCLSISSKSNAVDIYDSNLMKTTTATLASARSNMATAANDGGAAFVGGEIISSSKSVPANRAEAFTPSLERATLSKLNSAQTALGGSRAGKYVIFGGGTNSSGTTVKVANYYNEGLAKQSSTLSLSSQGNGSNGLSISDYGCIYSGNTIDAFSPTLSRATVNELPQGTSNSNPALSMGDVGVIRTSNYACTLDKELKISAILNTDTPRFGSVAGANNKLGLFVSDTSGNSQENTMEVFKVM